MRRVWGSAFVMLVARLSAAALAQNLLANPEFTSSLGSWAAQTGTGVDWAWDNANGFPTSDSAFGLNARNLGRSIILLKQCVPVSQTASGPR